LQHRKKDNYHGKKRLSKTNTSRINPLGNAKENKDASEYTALYPSGGTGDEIFINNLCLIQMATDIGFSQDPKS
jgi:hypothetical protein